MECAVDRLGELECRCLDPEDREERDVEVVTDDMGRMASSSDVDCVLEEWNEAFGSRWSAVALRWACGRGLAG